MWSQGLMQLMPATAQSLGVKDAFNPEENIMAGTRYLKQKLDEFDGNLALAWQLTMPAVVLFVNMAVFHLTRKPRLM